jgi:elongation factor P
VATLETNDFKKGVKLIHNGLPFTIVEFQHVKPGKGNAFTRTKIRNLQTGSVLEVTYRSGEKVEAAEIDDRSMTFLYGEGNVYHFMDSKNYDQVEIQEEVLNGAQSFLLPDMTCSVVFWNSRPITVEIPTHVELVVASCEPGVRGDTATNVTKPATLETGAQVNVPLFINVGDRLKIDTRTGEYIERKSIGGS